MQENLCFLINIGIYFFYSKSWITILNMKLEFEQIEILGIRSQRKTAKKTPINNKIQENKYICYITL